MRPSESSSAVVADISAGGTASVEFTEPPATWLPAPSTTGKPGPLQIPDRRPRAGVRRTSLGDEHLDRCAVRGLHRGHGAAREQEGVAAAGVTRMGHGLGEGDRDRVDVALLAARVLGRRREHDGRSGVGRRHGPAKRGVAGQVADARAAIDAPGRASPRAVPSNSDSTTFAPFDLRAGDLHAEHREAGRGRCQTGSEKRRVIESSRPSRSASPVSPAISCGDTPSRVER